MIREVISTSDAPPALGPYSQAIRAEGKFLFLSGQIPLTPGGELITGDIEGQTRQVMSNLQSVLSAAGLSFQNVVKTTIFLTSIEDFAKVNAIYGEVAGTEPPARSTFAVAALPKNAAVEIEAIAVY